MTTINKDDYQEVARYLNQKDNNDYDLYKTIDSAYEELQKIVSPVSTYKFFEKHEINGGIAIENFEVKSQELAIHLINCSSLYLFAATLGSEVDMAIRRASVTSIEKAAVMQAITAVMIEKYCDEVQKAIQKLIPNKFLVSRYSPGYGDCSLENQSIIFNLLNCKKTIGLSLTDSYMMVPTKSVSAFIGITDKADESFIKSSCCGNSKTGSNKCSSCNKKDCTFRR